MSSLDYLDLCRLCLVKDGVSVPIFEGEGDVRQIFLKIAACLPVKVAREDKLPKKICDNCVYKVELLYQFWNTTANAEKQLLQWLGEVGLEDKQGYVTGVLNTSTMKEEDDASSVIQSSIATTTPQSGIGIGVIDNIGLGMPFSGTTHQQQLPPTIPINQPIHQALPGPSNQPAPDQLSQTQGNATTRPQDEEEESSEEEDNSDDDCDADDGLPVKEESEEDLGNSRNIEPTTFVNVSLACDEAGPSGLQQQKNTTEIPELSMPQTLNESDAKSGPTGRLPRDIHGFDWEGENSEGSSALDALRIPIQTDPQIHVEGPQKRKRGMIWCIKEMDRLMKSPTPTSRTSLEKGSRSKVENRTHETFTPIKILKISKKKSGEIVIKEKNLVKKLRTKSPTACVEIKSTKVKDNGGKKKSEEIVVKEKNLVKKLSTKSPTARVEIKSTKVKDNDGKKKSKEIVVKETNVVKKLCTKSPTIHVEIESTKVKDDGTDSETEPTAVELFGDEPSNTFCTSCDRDFINRSDFWRHMRNHNTRRPWKCPQCPARSRSKQDLERHLACHDDQIFYSCDICDVRYKSQQALKNHHVRQHDDSVGQFSCENCGKTFKLKADLGAHIRVHRIDGTGFVCEVCGQSFNRRGSLVAHKRHHRVKVSNYPCPKCRLKFTSDLNLQNHLLKHREGFKCEQCNKEFNERSRLQYHMHRRHGNPEPQICSICGKPFKSINSLRTHILTHTGERPYKCDVCGESFTQRSSMMRHRRGHPGRFSPPPPIHITKIIQDIKEKAHASN